MGVPTDPPADSPASIRTRLFGLIDGGVLPAVRPRRMFVGQCLETHLCVACGMVIKAGDKEFEWTNPADLILFFHRQCAEIYRTLKDGHAGDGHTGDGHTGDGHAGDGHAGR